MITLAFAALVLAASPSRSREVIRRDDVTIETIAEGGGR
jgi:hypothetical protein